MPGPVPDRSSNLARPRERKGGKFKTDVITKGVAYPVVIPDPDPDWHPIAHRMWEALQTSGQSAYYQNSDWAMAYSLCDDLSYYKNGYKRSGQMLQVIYTTFASLLVTEGDRRRLRIELEEPEEGQEEASVTAINKYQKALGL